MNFTTAEVLIFDTQSQWGVARYVDEMNNARSVHFFGENHYRLVVANIHDLDWEGEKAELPMEPITEIVFNKAEAGIVNKWTTPGEMDRALLDLRSSYYALYQNDEEIWCGALTAKGEIHSDKRKLPRTLMDDMVIKQFVRSVDNMYPDDIIQLSRDEAIKVWIKMIEAKWVHAPIEGVFHG